MDRRPRLLTVIQIEPVSHILFLLLLLSLLMIGDGYVLILVSRIVGIYLLLATEATVGLVSVVVVIVSYRNTLARIEEDVKNHRYPENHFRTLGCLWAGAILLVIPGFVTDAIGLLVFLPPLRWIVGAWTMRTARDGFDELCEYIRLEE